MSNIIQFVPTHEISASENLNEFIRMCKEDVTVFGADLKWNSHYWPSAGITFGNINNKKGTSDTVNVISQPFLEFAKAYIRYQQGMKPTKNIQELRALKCVEYALRQMFGRADVLYLNRAVLDSAAVVAKDFFSAGQAYHAGREIARLAKFVTDMKLAANHISDWKNNIKRLEDTVRTGEKAKANREKKLPHQDALHAVAEVFASNPKDPRDIFTSCVVAMLLCAPSRVSEIISLPVNCEHFDYTGKADKTYGWRFIPSKNGEPFIKWIPDVMVPIAQEAIRRVRELTQEARNIAVWYEKNPNLFYRHKDCPNVNENTPLTVKDAALALGITHKYCRNELKRYGMNNNDGGNSLSSLNKWVIHNQPKGFPIFDQDRNLKYSEALFCMQAKQLRADMSASPVLVWKPNANTVNEDLSTIEKTPGVFNKSIFERHGYNEFRDEPLKLNTHQPRHLLNTMSQRGKLSQAEIARWSGRADVKQNRVYDHMSEFELVDMIRSHDQSLTLSRPLEEIAEQIAEQLPMSRHEFNTLAIPNAHITEFGFCIHDFVMNPCTRFADCINCTEQICIKGDRRLALMKEHHANVRTIIKNAEQEIAEGTAGADRWYEIHVLTEKRMANLIDILENPDIPNGSIIKLRNENEFNPLRRAIESRLGSQILSMSSEKPMLKKKRDSLGGNSG